MRYRSGGPTALVGPGCSWRAGAGWARRRPWPRSPGTRRSPHRRGAVRGGLAGRRPDRGGCPWGAVPPAPAGRAPTRWRGPPGGTGLRLRAGRSCGGRPAPPGHRTPAGGSRRPGAGPDRPPEVSAGPRGAGGESGAGRRRSWGIQIQKSPTVGSGLEGPGGRWPLGRAQGAVQADTPPPSPDLGATAGGQGEQRHAFDESLRGRFLSSEGRGSVV